MTIKTITSFVSALKNEVTAKNLKSKEAANQKL